MNPPTRTIIGNWKMNGDYALVMQMIAALRSVGPMARVTTVVCPPFPLLHGFADILGLAHVALGAQDCSIAGQGARTGEVSATMLAEQRCRYVILGHSERRKFVHESDADVAAKIAAARIAGLRPVICVGENLKERETNESEPFVMRQVSAALAAFKDAPQTEILIAYEPIWAIGGTAPASRSDIAGMHAVIRSHAAQAGFANVSVLYGGAVRPENCAEILAVPDVAGLLVGGASIDPDAFIAIAKTAESLA